ncbi:MAG: hypothetical protein AAGA68_21200 [Pseudomonadota bacterium]
MSPKNLIVVAYLILALAPAGAVHAELSPAEQSFQRSLGQQTRFEMRQRGDVARHARKREQYLRTLDRVGRPQPGKTRVPSTRVRKAARYAKGGVAAYAGAYVAGRIVGVDVPDPVEAAEWTYETLKDPKNIDKRLERLGHDSWREVHSGARTISDPKRMLRNTERLVSDTGKAVEEAGCSVVKVFGARC